MSKAIEKLKASVVERDSGPLGNLFAEWARRKGKLERLPFTQERLLESINSDPCLNRKDRERALGWYSKRFQNAKDKLEERGYIETTQMARGVGRPDTFLVLTEKGFSYLGKQGIKPEKLHGSLQHHCAILKMQSYYTEKGYRTKVNHPMTPKLFIDVLCEKEDERGAVEVVNSNNLKRDMEKIASLAGKLDWIHIVVTESDLFEQYVSASKNDLPASVRQKVTVSPLDELSSPEN